ncbi:MAG: hypothetical protein K2M47_05100 [Clostridiales bacterium]|nr:hypothetical protein [Clostridiales bacterium]
MKKRLVTILSLVMALVLCFTLVACGGNDGDSKGKDPAQSGKKVSISLGDAIDAVNSVLNADGFKGTASYTLSTKNTEALTESMTFEKRGNKVKVTAGTDESIADLQTGYVYYKGANGYTFDSEFYANELNYVQYVLDALKEETADQKIDVRYNKKANTVTYTLDKADSVNKYIQPLQNAYKKKKNVGSLLNDYCTLLFGTTFDSMYNEFEEYVKNPENTVGTLLDDLKDMGVDVEAILELYGYSLPAEQMDVIKARPLNKLVAGAYNYIMQNIGSMMTLAEDEADVDDSDYEEGGNGMASLGMGLLSAMLFDEVSDADITAGIQGLKAIVNAVKTPKVNEIIDGALAANEEAADLYIVIKNGVQLKNATMTFTLTVGDGNVINGIKVDGYVAHNYKGDAAEDSILADNDYRATAEITIDEYNTPTEDFVINFDPDCDYRASIISLLYDVTDKDVSVYFETGGKTADITVEQGLSVETLDGDVVVLDNVPADAFKFDAATSSFVFDGAVVKSALENADFGTTLFALVYFDGDENDLYAIGLSFVNDDLNDISDYLYDSAMDNILELIGGAGADAPNIGESNSIDGTYYYLTDDGELDENYYFEIDNGYIVTYIENGNDMTENVMLIVNGDEVVIVISYPETEEDPAYGIVLYGNVYANCINITSQDGYDENGECIGSIECDLYWYMYGAQLNA